MGKETALVTGGAGFIGSHTAIELVEAGYDVVIVDSLINSNAEVLKRLKMILKREVTFYNVNLLDKNALAEVFQKHNIVYVLHLAALKAVGESLQLPMMYYKNNIVATLNLLEVMKDHNVNRIVFSSSATVYGTPQRLPIDEEHPVGQCTNPYGKTKYFIEEILKDTQVADPNLRVVILRYFNPVGAHPSGLIGEDPNGIPNNLMPFVAQVAVGKRPEVKVFGSDYDTPDGTGVRDYIHVVDLAKGHVSALNKLKEPNCHYKIYNLGAGQGYSVLQMIKAMEKASDKTLAYSLVERRPGDVPTVYADPKLAEKELQWKAELGLDDMCKDLWNWQQKNPQGFATQLNSN